MRIELKMYNKKGLYRADAVFENGQVTVLKGSRIKRSQGGTFKRAKQVTECRQDEQLIKDNILQKDIVFKSPSTAAQLVTDSSTNGYESWKCLSGESLKTYLDTLARTE